MIDEFSLLGYSTYWLTLCSAARARETTIWTELGARPQVTFIPRALGLGAPAAARARRGSARRPAGPAPIAVALATPWLMPFMDGWARHANGSQCTTGPVALNVPAVACLANVCMCVPAGGDCR
jgi:hypothetical protein